MRKGESSPITNGEGLNTPYEKLFFFNGEVKVKTCNFLKVTKN